tara:strand:+ start:453 stop:854 length:402 start_codon:yes stop_codon:yes gene_type:complete
MLKKNTILGKVKVLFFFICLCINISYLSADETNSGGTEIEIKILDKVSSKNYKVKISIGEEKVFKNISIKPLKCKNSEFDDNPEIIAYLQVKDLKDTDNDEVFVFNGWTFSSSPSINTFDHPVYDIWLIKCSN